MSRCVYISNTRVSWCTEVHVGRSLQALGWEVLHLQEDEQTPGSIEREAIDFDANLVLYTRTWGQPAALNDVWARLEKRGMTTASYHLDLYLGLEREATLLGDPFWSTEYVFTPDGSPVSEARFREMGINHHWSPPAVVHDECVPGNFTERWAHEVVFVGSERYHREWPYRPQLISWLRRQYPDTFTRYGADSFVMRGQDLNDLYASAHAVVGDSLCLGFNHPNYWSDRVCETVGRGGILIHPRVPGLVEYMGLVHGEHLLFYEYRDFPELSKLITWCNENQTEARQMADRGRQYIRAHHTYLHRLAVALHTMGLRESPDVDEALVS